MSLGVDLCIRDSFLQKWSFPKLFGGEIGGAATTSFRFSLRRPPCYLIPSHRQQRQSALQAALTGQKRGRGGLGGAKRCGAFESSKAMHTSGCSSAPTPLPLEALYMSCSFAGRGGAGSIEGKPFLGAGTGRDGTERPFPTDREPGREGNEREREREREGAVSFFDACHPTGAVSTAVFNRPRTQLDGWLETGLHFPHVGEARLILPQTPCSGATRLVLRSCPLGSCC